VAVLNLTFKNDQRLTPLLSLKIIYA